MPEVSNDPPPVFLPTESVTTNTAAAPQAPAQAELPETVIEIVGVAPAPTA